MPPRVSQRDILPSAAKSRSLGNIIKLQDTGSASVTLNNGDDTILDILIINNKDANIIVEPEISLYQTSVAEANLIPFGASVDASEFQIIGPWNEWTGVEKFTDIGADEEIPSFATLTHMYIRNISAGASTVILARVRDRYITNQDDTTQTT